MKMISRYLTVPLLAVASCLSLAVSVARADDDEQGGDIDGTESLDIELAMTPTASAPAGSSIELSLEAEDDDGTTDATLTLETQGLPAGTFNVSVTLKSNGSTVALGSFTVDSEGEAEIEFTTNPQGDDNELPFPPNFNPFDIATVSVADSNNVVLFTADLTNTSMSTSMSLNASVQAQPGATDLNATGTAMLTASAAHSRPRGSIQLSGQGLPPKTALTILINGAPSNAKKAKTDVNGSLSRTIRPKGKLRTVATGVNVFQVISITVKDMAGNVLLSFSF